MPSPSNPLGIKLGTKFSLIAFPNHLGHRRTNKDAKGDLLTQNIARFHSTHTGVGIVAAKVASIESDRPTPCDAAFAESYTNRRQFRTADNGQIDMAMTLVEAGDRSGRNSTPIGKSLIQRLSAELPAETFVEVFSTYGACGENGRFAAEDSLPEFHRRAALTVKRTLRPRDAKFQKWEMRL